MWIKFALILGLVASCQKPDTVKTRLSDSSFGGRLNLVPTLGSGFNSVAGKLTGNQCVTQNATPISVWASTEKLVLPTVAETIESTEPTTINTSNAVVRFEQDLSYKKMQNSLKFGLDLKVNVYPGIDLHGEVDYLTSNANSSLDKTYSVIAQIQPLSRIIDNPKLSETFYETVARRQENPGHKDRPKATDFCGDEYVERVDKGLSLIATLSIKFNNHRDKSIMNGKLGATLLGFVDVDGVQVDHKIKNIAKQTRVTLSVLQKGGRPEELLTLIPDGGSLRDRRGIISCTLANVKPCYEAYQKVIQYISELSAQKQFDEADLYPLNFKTRSYSAQAFPEEYVDNEEDADQFLQTRKSFVKELKGGFKDLAIDKESLNQTRSLILTRMDETRDSLRIAEGMVAREAGYVGTARYAEFIDTFDGLKYNFGQLAEAYQECFSHPNRCIENATATFNRLRKVRVDKLSIMPESFRDWCAMYEGGLGDGDDRQTVAAIMRFAVREYSVPPTCDAISPVIATADFVEVPADENIRSLEPFTSLPMLRRLSVKNNTVVSLKPIQDMPLLEAVDLSGNLIADIGPLEHTSPVLMSVNLDRNEIRSPNRRLDRSRPFRRLFLQDNHIAAPSGFDGLASYIYLFGNPLDNEPGCAHCFTSKKVEFDFRN